MYVRLGVTTVAHLVTLMGRLREERGAAETSTILAWIVVGMLVVFALRTGLETTGNNVIDWVEDQVTKATTP